MADIYINFPACPEGYIRGDIDYDLEIMMEGWGMVSGGGASLIDSGFNVDLELETEDPTRVDQFIDQVLLPYLRSLPAPQETDLMVAVGGPEGVRRPVW